MAKKSRAARKNATQALQSNSGSSLVEDTTSGFASRIGDATASFSSASNDARKRVPPSAIYWGIGGLAVGALAVGAYRYRKQLAEVYERAMEMMDMADSQPAARKSKSAPGTKQASQH